MKTWQEMIDDFLNPEPVKPLPDQRTLRLDPVPKVVLLDIYGTLLSPTLGDLEEQRKRACDEASFVRTALDFGFSERTGLRWAEDFFRYIDAEHEACSRLGIQQTEVVVEAVWARLLRETGRDYDRDQICRIAFYREMMANPAAAFDGATQAIVQLKAMNLILGLASNAQFYTLPILERRLGIKVERTFHPHWCFLSYKVGFAKPDPHFFRMAAVQAVRSGFDPAQVLMVGNDPVNDVEAARLHGLSAVLVDPHGTFHERDPDPMTIHDLRTIPASLEPGKGQPLTQKGSETE